MKQDLDGRKLVRWTYCWEEQSAKSKIDSTKILKVKISAK